MKTVERGRKEVADRYKRRFNWGELGERRLTPAGTYYLYELY
jgi:hypothetical protein